MRKILFAAIVGIIGYVAYKKGFVEGREYQIKIQKN